MKTLQSHGTGAGSHLAPWFHNLHLPGGQTAPDHPLGDFPAFKWRQIAPHLPQDLDGARALDIGCNAGFYSFELARRGAAVTAIDVDPHYLRQADWAAGELGLSVDLRQMGVYDLARMDDEPFDIVVFMGVLYHLRHPLLALDLVAEKTAGTLVFQTLTAPGEERAVAPPDISHSQRDRERLRQPGWPTMAFIEHNLAGDPTNWWAPDGACVEAMLRSSGLVPEIQPGHEIWLCRRGEERSGWTARAVREELCAATGTSI